MATFRHPYYLIGVGVMAGAFTATPGHAQLGSIRTASNVSADAIVHRAQGGALTYHETTDANGIVVREYVDASNAVYAVSWHGPAMPDAQALLGTYFQRFRDAALASSGDAGLHATRIADSDLIVESHMRLREFTGRAWLASALPAGVSAADIQ